MYLIAALIIACSLAIGFVYNNLGFDLEQDQPTSNSFFQVGSTKQQCELEYGHLQCSEGKAVLPFYNPSSSPLHNISVRVKQGAGVNIYNVLQPLEAGTVETLTLPQLPCNSELEERDLRLSWCCQDQCFDQKATKPSDDLEIVKED